MAGKKKSSIDLTGFPAGTVTEYTTLVCLACIFDLFTEQLGLAPRTAYSEIKRYSPTIEELTAPKAVRPFFDSDEKNPHCPYCTAAKRWHARLDTYRIEGGKSTDAVRRKLINSLPKKDEQFRVVEARVDKRKIFFDWLDTLVHNLDLNDDGWLIECSRRFLERVDPKTNWEEELSGVRAIRRSNQLAGSWERSGPRLFLSPLLYHELMIVQYLVSRSHKHGGRTLEGRLTLLELIKRLRYSGYLDAEGITERNQFEVFEEVVGKLAGGPVKVKLYFIVDRRNFLEKVRVVYAHYAH
ncbi:MAG TPA: hypothetical protein VMM84_03360 [Pyrinomonadaceae bacterium]|nr:hypothetical protein [Pyrinomonadaceae bacterium]